MNLSIVMPLGPGEAPPMDLITRLGARPSQAEVILSVVDGQLDSAPVAARVVHGQPGRGRQQNLGAAAARGDWLWFVHADSQLPQDALERILSFVRTQAPTLGYCRLRFAADGPRLTHLNAMGANLRSRWFGLPYGDQGLCLPRGCFQDLGGFREDLARGEDLDFLVRARRAGLKLHPINITITTSSRRYREQGWLRTTIQHQLAAIRLIRQAR